jgi:hypothetical protein
MNLATRYCQVVSEYLATSVCQTTSNNLTIKEDCQRLFSDICLPTTSDNLAINSAKFLAIKNNA